mmetsp:Transcript_2755/g.9918  ORF Transcript_2755/g.9918 Transcript_2755/m.9918 type:complete len:205 (+) Transcript_2755:1805-2419(+)
MDRVEARAKGGGNGVEAGGRHGLCDDLLEPNEQPDLAPERRRPHLEVVDRRVGGRQRRIILARRAVVGALGGLARGRREERRRVEKREDLGAPLRPRRLAAESRFNADVVDEDNLGEDPPALQPDRLAVADFRREPAVVAGRLLDVVRRLARAVLGHGRPRLARAVRELEEHAGVEERRVGKVALGHSEVVKDLDVEDAVARNR